MNKVYRVIWSRTRQCFVVVHEYAKAFGKGSSTVRKGAAAAAAGLLAAGPGLAGEVAPDALPTGGRITAGSGAISQSGAEMTVRQDTARLIATWDSFDIGSEAGVTFRQPDTSSVALNRVLGQDPSRILGRLSANGHVMLVNPNGVVFGPNSRVNVGGITASTLDIADEDFLAGDYRFTNAGTDAAVENHGAITAEGGVVALVAPVVRNEGTIATPGGSAALAAGDAVTLDFTGDGLVTVTVDKARLDALVANGGAVRADEGVVVLSAGAAREVLAGAVNNTGIVEARGLVADGGRIVLGGGTVTQAGTLDVSSEAGRGGRVEIAATDIALTGNSRIDATGATGGGTVHVGGAWQGGGDGPQARTVTMAEGAVIDASATEQGNGGEVVLWSDVDDAASRTAVAGTIRAEGGAQGGDGGRVETSGRDLDIAETTKVSTLAPGGAAGQWLLDPQDFIIAESGGDITGATLSSNLAGGNVEILSSSGGTAGNGDILVNDTVNWSANTLTLTAARDIRINAVMSASGAAALTMNTATANGSDSAVGGGTVRVGFAADGTFAGRVDYSASGALTINGATYTVIHDVTGLQGMSDNLSENYVLGADIDASGTSTWNSNAGFDPIGDSITAFTGTFDGLGHGISNLSIDRPSTNDAGLFGYIGEDGVARNVGLGGGSVTGAENVGALVGTNRGTVADTYATTSVAGEDNVGGLVGYNSINDNVVRSHASGTVTGTYYVGGLVGKSDGPVIDSYATGDVDGDSTVGGLVGHNSNGGAIADSYATGAVSGIGNWIGGLVGSSVGSITRVYATGNVSGDSYVGGLVGRNFRSISEAYATGAVSGAGFVVGGLVGTNQDTITNAYATGAVSAADYVGGLVGLNDTDTTISGAYWDTDTTGQASGIGTDYGNQLGHVVGLTTADALTQGNYGAFDFTNDWFMVDGATRPMLRAEYSTTIRNAHQLQLMAMDLSADYTLAGDIDFGTVFTDTTRADVWATSGSAGAGFAPVGDLYRAFTGAFDGMGHTINGLTINRPSAASDEYIGLFGAVGAGGQVRNVGLTSGSVTGNSVVGALVGMNSGTVTASHSGVNVSGTSQLGGLVGYNGGTVRDAYATGSVSGSDVLGGLVGWNGDTVTTSYATGAVSGTGNWVGGLVGSGDGSVTRSYATGSVSGNWRVGGLVGENTGTITNTYATGSVTGSNYVGGLVGENGGSVSDSYWDTTTTGQATSAGGTGLTTADMQDPFTFIEAGWDFANVWGKSRSGENSGYMILRALNDTGYDYYVRLADTDATKTYGDLALDGVALQGAGAGNVTLAVAAGTEVGTYSYGSDVLAPQFSVGTAADYYFDYGSGTLTVTPRPVDISGSRVYDGTTGVDAGVLSLGNLVAGEDLTLTGAGSTSDKNAGTGKPLSLGTLALADGSSGKASNYTLVGGTHTVTIDQRPLALSGLSAADKTYDGTAGATVTGYGSLDNLVTGDAVSLDSSGGSAAFADADAGTGKTVTVSGLGLSGADAGNYSIGDQTTTAAILPAPLTVTADDKTTTYDGQTFTAGGGTFTVSYSGFVNGEGESVLSGTPSFSGDATTATDAGSYAIAPSGLSANNYAISYVNGTLTITPRPLGLSSLSAADKTYDGTTAATVTGYGSLTNVIGGDSVTFGTSSVSAAFADADAGTGKTVTVAGLSLSGADAGNYSIGPLLTTADILRRSVTIGGSFAVADKTYDGTTAATVTQYNLTLSNTLAGDDVAVAPAAAFAQAEIGQDIPVHLTNATGLTGADAGNYVIDLTGAPTTTANITSGENPPPVPPAEPDGGDDPGAGDAVTGTGTGADDPFAPEPLITFADAGGGNGDGAGGEAGSGSLVLGDGAGGAVPFRLGRDGDAAVLTLAGGEAGGSAGPLTLPVYTLGPGGVAAAESLRVRQDGPRWTGTPAGGAPPAPPAGAGEAERTATVALRLPNGRAGSMRVGVTGTGVLLLRAPAAVQEAFARPHLLLLALAAATQRLDLAPADLTAVVIQPGEEAS